MAKKPAKRLAAPDFKVKKWPQQPRSQTTFDAIVEACARLLTTRGYAALTTNHVAEAAGVGIASVYEYFPGKDAIVAQVAERFVRRVLTRLEAAVPEIVRAPPEQAVRMWIEVIYATIEREKKLFAVFIHEYPYTYRLAATRQVTPLLLELARSIRARLGERLTIEREDATLFVMVHLVASSIQQLVLDPPEDIPKEEVIAVLASSIEGWIAAA